MDKTCSFSSATYRAIGSSLALLLLRLLLWITSRGETVSTDDTEGSFADSRNLGGQPVLSSREQTDDSSTSAATMGWRVATVSSSLSAKKFWDTLGDRHIFRSVRDVGDATSAGLLGLRNFFDFSISKMRLVGTVNESWDAIEQIGEAGLVERLLIPPILILGDFSKVLFGRKLSDGRRTPLGDFLIGMSDSFIGDSFRGDCFVGDSLVSSTAGLVSFESNEDSDRDLWFKRREAWSEGRRGFLPEMGGKEIFPSPPSRFESLGNDMVEFFNENILKMYTAWDRLLNCTKSVGFENPNASLLYLRFDAYYITVVLKIPRFLFNFHGFPSKKELQNDFHLRG